MINLLLTDVEKQIASLKEKAEQLGHAKAGDFRQALSGLVSSFDKLLATCKKLKFETTQEINNFSDQIVDLARVIEEIQQESEQSEDQLLASLKKQQEKFKKIVLMWKEEEKQLKEGISKLNALIDAPRPYGTFLRITNEKERRADVELNQKRIEVYVNESIKLEDLKEGQRVRLTPQGNILEAPVEREEIGEEVIVDEVLSKGKVRVTARAGDKEIAKISGFLKKKSLNPGDSCLYDRKSGFLLKKLPKKESSELLIEAIPDLTYAQIGGQEKALQKLREMVEYRFEYPELFAKYTPPGATKIAPKGLLLFGPPGCGKTMTLKAVANALQKKLGKKVLLLSVGGPQFLNMWVGETQRQIRELFDLAKVKAKEETFVIVLFDEIDAMFLTRGSRAGSTGVHETAVTQFSTKLDGIEEYGNIIVIGTTNRPDMLDPALTRPGRLYPPIEFPRPNREGVVEILKIYLKPLVDLIHQQYIDSSHPQYEERYASFEGKKTKVIEEYFIPRATSLIFGEKSDVVGSEEKAFERFDLKKTKVIGIEFSDTYETKTFYMKDLISGTLIAEIAGRTQMRGVLAEIAGEEGGLRVHYLLDSIEEVFKEGEALPNRGNPQEWAAILGIPADRPFRIMGRNKKTKKGKRRTAV